MPELKLIHLGENKDNIVFRGKISSTNRTPYPFIDTTGSKVIIGEEVTISSGVYIHTHTHQFNKKDWRNLPIIKSDIPTVLDDYSFIGVNSQIMHTCKSIGKYSVIAAGSIVTKNVPDFEIWAGNPAKKIGDVER